MVDAYQTQFTKAIYLKYDRKLDAITSNNQITLKYNKQQHGQLEEPLLPNVWSHNSILGFPFYIYDSVC